MERFYLNGTSLDYFHLTPSQPFCCCFLLSNKPKILTEREREFSLLITTPRDRKTKKYTASYENNITSCHILIYCYLHIPSLICLSIYTSRNVHIYKLGL